MYEILSAWHRIKIEANYEKSLSLFIFHRPVILYFARNTFLVFKFIVSSYATLCSAGKFDGFILEIIVTVERNSMGLPAARIS
jgi:hypothetical protein